MPLEVKIKRHFLNIFYHDIYGAQSLNTTSTLTLEAQLKSIQHLIQSAKFNDAIEQSKQLQKQVSNTQEQVELWYLLAIAQRYAKNYTEALNSINTLLELDNRHSRAHQEQGYLNLAKHNAQQAKLAFESAVTLNPSLVASWQEATASIKENLLGIAPEDPLGIDVGDLTDLATVAIEQEVELSTYQVMQAAFVGQLGAFSYLLFILLYTPCVAAMGAIKNEVGTRWAGFAATWSFLLAYLMATLCFQIGTFLTTPLISSCYILGVFLCFTAVYLWLKHQGRKVLTIPISVSYS